MVNFCGFKLLQAKLSRPCLGIRHLQAFLVWLGVMSSMGTKSEMSMAIVAMTDLQDTSQITFDWDFSEQGYVLSATRWGYIVTMIPAGVMTHYIGGIPLLIFSTAIHSVMCLLTPVAAIYGGWPSMCALCAIQGIALGLFLPAVISILAKWVPMEEKSRLVGFVYSGAPLGTAMAMLLSGFVAQKWGWPVIFYIHGLFGIVLSILFIFFGSNSPQSSKWISVKERSYIEHSLKHVAFGVKLKIPWKSIFTCLPVWAVVMSTTGFNWGFNVIVTAVPTYMKHILNAELQDNGWMSAIPYLLLCCMCYVFGTASDYVLKNKLLTVNACRKTSNAIATYAPALFLVIISLSPVDKTSFVVILSIGIGLCAGYFTGDGLMYLDMAPNFASTIHSMSQFCADCISIFAPIVTGAIVKDLKNPNDWKIIFCLTAIIYVATNTFFLIFGSAVRQPWNNPEENTHHTDDKDKSGVKEAEVL